MLEASLSEELSKIGIGHNTSRVVVKLFLLSSEWVPCWGLSDLPLSLDWSTGDDTVGIYWDIIIVDITLVVKIYIIILSFFLLLFYYGYTQTCPLPLMS